MIIRVPENKLLEHIRKIDKDTLHIENSLEFENSYNYFSTNKFWVKDKSYQFLNENLSDILKKLNSVSLIDLGCYVGSLPIFLQKNNYLDKVHYTGVDLIQSALNIAKKHFPELNFQKEDLQYFKTELSYDIVYSKGTIISTFYPDLALDSILNIDGKYIILCHQPLFLKNNSSNKYETILVIKNENIYTSTVLYQDYFLRAIQQSNYKILKVKKRFFSTKVENFQNYFLYDFILQKKNE